MWALSLPPSTPDWMLQNSFGHEHASVFKVRVFATRWLSKVARRWHGVSDRQTSAAKSAVVFVGRADWRVVVCLQVCGMASSCRSSCQVPVMCRARSITGDAVLLSYKNALSSSADVPRELPCARHAGQDATGGHARPH